MKLKSQLTAVIIAGLSLLSPVLALPVSAAAPIGLTMSPVNFTGNYRPGEVINTRFTLRNDTQAAMALSLSPIALNGNQLITDSTAPVSWTTIDQTELNLAPQQSTEVNVSVHIPDAATKGGYYPAVKIRLVSADSTGNTGTTVDANLTFQMAVNVTSDIPVNPIQVTSLNASNPVLTGNVTIDYTITNPLTLFIKPIAYLQVLNPQNEVVYTTTINENLQTLKPGATLTGTVTAPIPMDIRSIGQYRVELLALDKQFSGAAILKTNFVAVPIWLLIAAIVLVILVLVVGNTFRKRGSRRKAV